MPALVAAHDRQRLMVVGDDGAIGALVGDRHRAAAVADQHVELTEAFAERSLLIVVEVLGREDQQRVLDERVGDGGPLIVGQAGERDPRDDGAERRIERLDDHGHVTPRCRVRRRWPRR